MRKLLLSLALGLGLMASTATAAEESPNKGGLKFDATLDVVSNYYFRGYLQTNSGFIVQPGVYVGVSVFENDQFNLMLTGGVWSSMHTDQKSDALGAAIKSPEGLYEIDFVVRLDTVIAKQFKVGAVFTWYTYPSYVSGEILELGFEGRWLSYETAKSAGSPVSFDVYGGVYFELYDDSFAGASNDIFAKLGVELGLLQPVKAGDVSFEIVFPIELGLSFQDYYFESDGTNDVLGYIMAGAQAGMNLPMPAQYGAWKVVAGAYIYYLQSDSVENANNGEEFAYSAKVGLAISY